MKRSLIAFFGFLLVVFAVLAYTNVFETQDAVAAVCAPYQWECYAVPPPGDPDDCYPVGSCPTYHYEHQCLPGGNGWNNNRLCPRGCDQWGARCASIQQIGPYGNADI